MDRSELKDRFKRVDRRNAVMTVLIVVFACFLIILLLRLSATWKQKQYNVAVTQLELPRGTHVSASQLTWKTYPADKIEPGYLTQSRTTLERLNGGIITHSLGANEPLTPKNFLFPGATIDYQALLRSDKRAIVLPIASIGPNFVQPGNSVDIILTFDPATLDPARVVRATSRGGNLESKTILKNVLVLGVYPLASEAGKSSTLSVLTSGRGDALVKWVTFEVTPKQAEMMSVADKMGTVSLSLQGEVIGESIEGRSYTTSRAVAGLEGVQSNTVTIIRGSSKEVIDLGR